MSDTARNIRILLIDDHFVVRSGIVASLELEDDIEVVGEAESGEAGLTVYAEEKPDIVLLDLQLPDIDGIATAGQLLEIDSNAKILIFSTFAKDDQINAALEAGALGYLQKSSTREELLEAIRTVAEGEISIPAEIAERLEKLRTGPAITTREREIVALVSQGKANKEIAAALGIAEDTVKRHVSAILQKFGVNDRAGATAEAIRRGIIQVDDSASET
ncbi:MAG: response regulator transcription factor [Verrucomicrobiales bacterium]|nr:response regulator transcription factor [Verrucomicrobiales bacterium]